MEKLYRVFVSSTYEDLKEERGEVMRTLLRQDHIPSGMEMFNAGNEEQWRVIQRVIDLCDYHIVIVGNRYGSTLIDGMSYTEREYRYALETKKYIMGFVHTQRDALPVDPAEDNSATRARLENFIALVKAKPCGFWGNAHHLSSLVSTAMHQAVKVDPREGWVRDGDYDALRLKVDALTQQVEVLRQVPSSQPAEIGLDLSYKKVPPSDGRVHNYELRIDIVNNAKLRIDDWELELRFPTALLQPGTKYGNQVMEQSDERRSLFRWNGLSMKKPLRPRENVRLQFSYRVDQARYDLRRTW